MEERKVFKVTINASTEIVPAYSDTKVDAISVASNWYQEKYKDVIGRGEIYSVMVEEITLLAL